MAKEIICESCGGKFDSELPKCPFCGTLNISGAESEYMEKLGDVHEDMEALKNVPKEELRQAAKRSGNYLKKVLIGTFAAGGLLALLIGGWTLWENKRYSQGNAKENYFWKEENFPVLDQLYADGKYDELSEAIWEAVRENRPIYDWEHYSFVSIYDSVTSAQTALEHEQQVEEMSWRNYSVLLRDQWRIYWLKSNGWSEDLSEEEKDMLNAISEALLQDFESRWNFSQDVYDKMYDEAKNNLGWVSFKLTDSYAKEWLANKDKAE